MIAASPTVWAGHFLASYITAAIWCAKMAAPIDSLSSDAVSIAPVRLAIIGYTVVALVAIGLAGWRGARSHRYGGTTVPHDFDTPEDRHRFLGFATLLLSGLSAVATIYVALTILFVETCH